MSLINKILCDKSHRLALDRSCRSLSSHRFDWSSGTSLSLSLSLSLRSRCRMIGRNMICKRKLRNRPNSCLRRAHMWRRRTRSKSFCCRYSRRRRWVMAMSSHRCRRDMWGRMSRICSLDDISRRGRRICSSLRDTHSLRWMGMGLS